MDINASEWEQNIPSPASRVELAEWQAKLNAVAGMYGETTPNVLLLWGMDGDPRYQIFDRVRYRWVMPYVSRHGVEGADIGVARYFLRLLDPFLMDSPNQSASVQRATAVEPDGREVTEDVRTIARAQFKGLPYVRYKRWSLDDPPGDGGLRACCLRQQELGKACYGEYLAPDERMIQMVANEFFQARNYAGNEVDAARFIRAQMAKDEMYAEVQKEKQKVERQRMMHDYFTAAARAKSGHWSLPNAPLIRAA